MVVSLSIEAMKKLCFDSSVVNNSLDSLKESTNLNTEALDSIKTTLEKNTQVLTELANGMKEHQKNQKLEWAITNAGIGSFHYFVKGKPQQLMSTDFVREILMSFRKGPGYYIYDRSKENYYSNKNESGEEKFRDALSNQIANLIGKTPRISLAKEGYAIYYE